MSLQHAAATTPAQAKGPNRVARVFERCRSEKRAAFIAFLTAGYPSLEATPALVRAVCEGGADIIEIGFPYSDPIADGPVIQASSQHALVHGATFERILEMLATLSVAQPLLAFTYYNVLLVRGVERAATELAAAGLFGAIVPDLPPEEAAPLAGAFARNELSLTYLVAPTTPLERAAFVARQSDDFVYVAGRMGVTGPHAAADNSLESRIAALRTIMDKPIAVGFGVSQPEHVAAIAAIADGVVVGSALVEACSAPDPARALRDACGLLRPPQ